MKNTTNILPEVNYAGGKVQQVRKSPLRRTPTSLNDLKEGFSYLIIVHDYGNYLVSREMLEREINGLEPLYKSKKLSNLEMHKLLEM